MSRKREILDRAIRANTGRMNTTVIAKVLSYSTNGGAPVAKVLPVWRIGKNNGEIVDPSPVPKVPVPPIAWGEFLIHAPLKSGDYVVCHAAQRSLDDVMRGASVPITPDDGRRFDVNDLVVDRKIEIEGEDLPMGLKDDALTIAKRDGQSEIVMKSDGSVYVKSSDIRLGSPTASQFVALAALVVAELNKLWAALRAHGHTIAGQAAPSGTVTGTANPNMGIVGQAGDVSSTTTKSD